ncbi:MAG TPA: ABC transporter ATP-binding protein [Bacteroidia bacterium]|jgi:lipopolysaccharide transport system ATP-binding protein|nr:ABC transporter ATP-binding protein [Bacteroidia bacterium]
MSKAIITVEHLSKSFILKHQQKERYTTLRDTLANKAKQILKGASGTSLQTEEFWALNDLSFEINQGDRVGIIGRNGAGKSTLLKVLSRIVAPTKGRITIDGRIASLLEVGTGFHPELSGRENIFLNGSILGMTKTEIKNKFDEIVAFAEVEKFLDTPVKRYSSGMYVRLAFAVAAHLEPEILVVDEVLAVGDAAFQKKCLGKMKDVSQEGRTVLFVSHNMEAVQKLCTTGILMQQGRLLEQGGIDPIVTKYLEVYASSVSTYEIAIPENHETIPGYAYQLKIEDINGNPISEVPIGEAWQVRVSFKLTKDTPHFIIALGISTLFDLSLRTTWTIAGDYKKGTYEVVFKNDDIVLADGQYKFVVGLSTEKIPFHYIEEAGFITISDVSSLTNQSQVVNTKSGILINQMKAVITKID